MIKQSEQSFEDQLVDIASSESLKEVDLLSHMKDLDLNEISKSDMGNR